METEPLRDVHVKWWHRDDFFALNFSIIIKLDFLHRKKCEIRSDSASSPAPKKVCIESSAKKSFPLP